MEQKTVSLKNLEKIETSGLLPLAPDLLDKLPHHGFTTTHFNKRLAPLATAIASNHLTAAMAEAEAQGIIEQFDIGSDKSAHVLQAKDLVKLSDALKNKAFFHKVLCRKRAELLAKSAPQGFSAADMAFWHIVNQAQLDMQKEIKELGKRRVYELEEQLIHNNVFHDNGQNKRLRREKVEAEIRESFTKEESKIKERFGFVGKFTTSCSKLETMAESENIRTPDQQICISLHALKDDPSLCEEILLFARGQVSVLEKKYAKDRTQRKARELLEIASAIKGNIASAGLHKKSS